MCNPAPVAQAAWRDVQKIESGLVYLGICGDFAHSQRRSGHNCGQAPGGQESPVNGVSYDTRYCHALDVGHGGDRAKAKRIRDAFLADSRTRYVIDDGIGYYPPHRGGGTFRSTGHTTHVHVSFMPGTTFDVRPFFSGSAPTTEGSWLMAGEKEEIQRDIRLAIGLIIGDAKKRQDELEALIKRKADRAKERDQALGLALVKLGANDAEIQAKLDEINAGEDADDAKIVVISVPTDDELKEALGHQ